MEKNVYRMSFLKEVSKASNDAHLTESFQQTLLKLSPSYDLLNNAYSFFFLFDFVQMKYLYVSEGIRDIAGFTAEEWKTAGPDFAFSRVVEEDVPRLKALHKALFDFYYSIPVEERLGYKYAYEVRIKTKQSKEIWLIQQGSFISVDPSGKPLLSFDILTDITHFKKGKCMTLNMYKNDTCKNINTFFPINGAAKFSSREIEIIRLLSEGMSSEMIAKKLFLSIHTVKNHRKNILKKAETNNSKELIRYAFENGLV